MSHKPSDTVGEVSRSVATPPVIGKTDLQSGGRTGLPGRHLREQTANSEFANSVPPFLRHDAAESLPHLRGRAWLWVGVESKGDVDPAAPDVVPQSESAAIFGQRQSPISGLGQELRSCLRRDGG